MKTENINMKRIITVVTIFIFSLLRLSIPLNVRGFARTKYGFLCPRSPFALAYALAPLAPNRLSNEPYYFYFCSISYSKQNINCFVLKNANFLYINSPIFYFISVILCIHHPINQSSQLIQCTVQFQQPLANLYTAILRPQSSKKHSSNNSTPL